MSVQQCPFYLQGKCKYGDTCRLPHSSPVTPSPRSNGFIPRSSPMTKFSAAQACRFYERGNCSKGNKCTFQHVPSARESSLVPISINSNPGNASSSSRPCIFFKQQNCRAGYACPFSHDASDSPRQSPPEGIVSVGAVGGPKYQGKAVTIRRPDTLASPILSCQKLKLKPSRSHVQSVATQIPNENLKEREIDGSKVVFAPGPTVHSVETVFESRTVILTSIPSISSREDILQLLSPSCEYRRFTFDPKTAPLTARLELPSAKQAVEISESLYGMKLHGVKICARIDCARVATDTGSLRSTKVKVSWFKPTRIAWSHYSIYPRDPYPYAQREVERLRGKTFNTNKLSITLQSMALNQRSSFSIEIKGLPLKFKEEDLKKFCHASSVTVGKASFDGNNSYEKVKQLLRMHGTIESIEAAETSTKSKKIALFVHYREWSEAENACKALHLQPQNFLRYSQLMLENVHTIRYKIRQVQYEVLEGELLKLQRRQPQGCKLRIYDETDSDTVCVRGYSSSAKNLASLKISIEVLLRGETLKLADGSIPWEDRYARDDTQQPFLELASNRQCWIKFDLVHRRMVLYGSPADCKALRSDLTQTFEAQMKRRHTISLDASAMRGLLTGGLAHVEQLVGEGKARLDIGYRTLTLEGSDSALIETKRLLQTLDQPRRFHLGPSCPVCLEDPVNPTVLGCGHAYCTECIMRYLKAQSTNRTPNCCCLFVQDDKPCESPVSTDVLRRLLTPEEEARIFKAVYLNYIHSRPKEFIYCPVADCPTIYRRTPGILRCPSCLTKICSSCDVEYHDGITCGEYQEEVRKELAIMEVWKQELGVRSCSNCQTNLNKGKGCNHLLCTHCGRHICWVCMETFEDSKSCYIHMGAAHAGIGLPQHDV